MKKITLLAGMAMVAGMASAQYTVNPTVNTVLDNTKVSTLYPIAVDETSVKAFEAQGATVVPMGPDGIDRNLWVWDDTFIGGDASYPGVGDHFDGYASFVVGSAGWSGAGYNISGAGANTTSWNDNTRFHIAYMSPGTVCPSIALTIADGEGDCGSIPAKVTLGTAFNDNGTTFPSIAPVATDDWQGADIDFATLKKLWPAFSYKAIDAWKGNILAFLGGGVTGQTLAFDAVYFYTPASEGAVDGIAADNAAWVVTRNTVNCSGAEAVALYDLSGKLVKEAAGSVLGLNGVEAGLYIARAGKAAIKVLVK